MFAAREYHHNAPESRQHQRHFRQLNEYGRSITAYGWTINPSGDTPLGLYYKNQGFDETGLGIIGPSDHELQSSGGLPLQYIQLDLGAILATGKVFDGKLQIGSVQSS